MTKRVNSGSFDSLESERALRVVKLTAHAEEIFISHTHAIEWLNHPNRSLGGVTPLSLCDTEIGGNEAEESLIRIAHGVFS